MTLGNILIAVVMAIVIWKTAIFFIRMLASPPEEVHPEDAHETLANYRCQVCGAEVTMTMENERQMGELRHCREEMVLVWRPDDPENT